jgi:hypothetical protein
MQNEVKIRLKFYSEKLTTRDHLEGLDENKTLIQDLYSETHTGCVIEIKIYFWGLAQASIEIKIASWGLAQAV